MRYGLALLLLATFGPVSARAHLALIEPPSRYGPDVLKSEPCGRRGGVRSTNVVTAEPGSTLVVRWDEYINHPGHYRIAFDPDGDDDFTDPVCIAHCTSARDPEPPEFELRSDATVLMDGIADNRGGEYEVTITLPDIECDNCTLQVIQVMYDKRPYTSPGNDNYYQCVDLVLTRGGPPPDDAGTPDPDAGTVDPDGGPALDPDAGGMTASDAGTVSGSSDGGCCSTSGARTAPPWLVLSCLLGLLVVRRTRRR